MVLKGETNIAYLKENGVKIWDEWADSNGDLGPVYGHQWRNWNSEEIDQIRELIETLKQIQIVDECLFQHGILLFCLTHLFHLRKMWLMEKQLYHRVMRFSVLCSRWEIIVSIISKKCRYLLGVPFNIASYALFTMMVAQVCGFEAGEFIHTFW